MTSALLLLATIPGIDPQPVRDVQLSPGFTASLYSDPALANDIYTMTIDADGRVLVAGRGYVRALVDDDSDGRADGAIDLIDGLKDGPMGLIAEGDSLYVVADGALKRYRGYNGRDMLTKPPEMLLKVRTGGEHHAHAVKRGPDGWLYFICGNNTGVTKDILDPLRSPVKDPVAGCLLRISPDGKTVECVADGLRNAYDFDFNLAGEPFTYDSDNERCVGLPWYEGCRFYHLVPGGNYGWRSPQLSQTWRKPPYFADVVPPIADLGRGSPTGVACYRHTQFPEKYHGGFFLADWTFGRVYFASLKSKGSTYEGKPEIFLQPTGESGFAPTALAVHPKTGELYISIGGRGTRGAVYRIRAERQQGEAKPLPVGERSLGWDAKESRKQWLADAADDDDLKRRQALELMLRYREKMGYDQALFDAVLPNLDHDDALVRAAAGRMAIDAAIPARKPRTVQGLLALALARVKDDADWSFETALAVLKNSPNADYQLQAVRVIQLALGDLTAPGTAGTVWEGYTFRKPTPPQVEKQLKRVFHFLRPENHQLLRRELGRTAAAVGGIYSGGLPWPALCSVTNANDDFHDLIVVARLGGLTEPHRFWIASGLLELDQKVASENSDRDRHWPLRLTEVMNRLAEIQPRLGEAVLSERVFGRPDHILLVKALKLDPAESARRFLAAAKLDPDYAWTPSLVSLLGSLPPEESRPVLAELWKRPGLEDAIVPILARDPRPEDSPKLVVGLTSLDPGVVKSAAAALSKLDAPKDQSETLAAIKALRWLPNEKPNLAARKAVAKLLSSRTGQKFGTDTSRWTAWFAKEHPDLTIKLTASDGFDPTAWKVREAKIPWANGDPARGRLAFTKATCAACHDGGGAVGPSLVGVGKRFGRDDLLTAILQPSRDVSPRYRPTRITTTDGKAHVGMIVYEATSGVIVQTAPDTTVRIAGEDIESKRTLDTSLMPAGLLDKLTDREMADLMAYLRSLDGSVP